MQQVRCRKGKLFLQRTIKLPENFQMPGGDNHAEIVSTTICRCISAPAAT